MLEKDLVAPIIVLLEGPSANAREGSSAQLPAQRLAWSGRAAADGIPPSTGGYGTAACRCS